MRLKQLESALCNVPNVEFYAPNVELEQYPTSAHLTAQIIYMAYEQYHDIGPNRTVVDLGCGTAMLSIGCALVDTDHIIGVDCDTAALEQAQENVNAMELLDRISFVHGKVSLHSNRASIDHKSSSSSSSSSRTNSNRNSGRMGRSRPNNQRKAVDYKSTTNKGDKSDTNTTNDNERVDVPSSSIDKLSSACDDIGNVDRTKFLLHDKCVDTVITNPPFGTKGDMAGIDIEFVLVACQLATRAVYSFHKTTTRDYILRTIKANVANVHSVSVIAEMKFNIQNTYKFHQCKSVDIAVDLIRIEFISNDTAR